MKIRILDRAEEDLLHGYHFYEEQEIGIGSYFLSNLYADIESLLSYAGIHPKTYKGYHRLLSNRFPYAVYSDFLFRKIVRPYSSKGLMATPLFQMYGTSTLLKCDSEQVEDLLLLGVGGVDMVELNTVEHHFFTADAHEAFQGHLQ